MSAANAFPNVLVAGATGKLGGSFVNALLESPLKFNVSILVREATAKDATKKAALDAFTSRGAKIVHGDVLAPETLPAALKGIDLVISTLSGEGLFSGVGEVELVKAAKAAGVKRFVPSQFGVDIHDYTLGQYPFVDAKVKTVEELKKQGLDHVIVTTNGWLEYSLSPFLSFDVINSDSVLVPGDGNSFISLTSIQDVPRLAIPAIVDPANKNAHVTVAGSSLTWNQIVDLAEKTLGKKITRKYVDGAAIGEIISKVEDPLGKFGLWIQSLAATVPARGDFRSTAYNLKHPEKYTHVKPITIEQYLQNAKKH